jgi:hypothetical protein
MLAVAAIGCGRRAPNATPDGTVRELVDRLRRVQGDPRDAKAAYALLSKRAQENLEARAKRYSAASGRTIAPESMLVPWRTSFRFEPQKYVAQPFGDHARVSIVGPHTDDRAEVFCSFEKGVWTVDVDLPALPAVQMRPASVER